jgi:hypothetical protein
MRADQADMHREVAMYTSIRRYKIALNVIDDVTQQVQSGFLPLISRMPGFVEYYWVNAGNGFMVSVSVFQDRASAEESTRMAADYVRQFLSALVRNPPDVTEGEIVIHQVGPPGATAP